MDYVSGIGLYLYLLQKKERRREAKPDAHIERDPPRDTRPSRRIRLFCSTAYAVSARPRRKAMIDLLSPKALS